MAIIFITLCFIGPVLFYMLYMKVIMVCSRPAYELSTSRIVISTLIYQILFSLIVWYFYIELLTFYFGLYFMFVTFGGASRILTFDSSSDVYNEYVMSFIFMGLLSTGVFSIVLGV